MKFKVAKPGGRWTYGFTLLESASQYADLIFRRTGVVVAVVSYKPKRRTR